MNWWHILGATLLKCELQTGNTTWLPPLCLWGLSKRCTYTSLLRKISSNLQVASAVLSAAEQSAGSQTDACWYRVNQQDEGGLKGGGITFAWFHFKLTLQALEMRTKKKAVSQAEGSACLAEHGLLKFIEMFRLFKSKQQWSLEQLN